uniref:Uncharacterized protein n=1 Tax=Fagus sylvatica TaxID=28930 RepID=A0A2N9EC98_FAGSY
MRRRTLFLPNTIKNFSNATRQSLIPFSTSSSSGGGRGRGRGFGAPQFDFVAPGKPEPQVPESKPDPTLPGLGHGRGRPLPSSSPTLPAFSSFVSSIKPPPTTTGRGRVPTDSAPPAPPDSAPKQPIFFKKQDVSGIGHGRGQGHVLDMLERNLNLNLPQSIVSELTGSGRGKPMKQPGPEEAPIIQENRHLRAQPKARAQAQAQPRMSQEEAKMNAVNILSRRRAGEDAGGEESSVRGRGGGRGGFRGRFRDRGRGRMNNRGRERDSEDGYGAGLYLGDNADGEKLAKRLGLENMNLLTEAYEEMGSRVLPSPLDDALLDAMDVNYAIECEPEYLMGEFDRNPDIDEKPPIPLRDALEKMKPFLMVYEGIQSQEEWEVLFYVSCYSLI